MAPTNENNLNNLRYQQQLLTNDTTTIMAADFIQKMPKVELHVHIEGTMEPEMQIAFAKRNNVLKNMKCKTAAELAHAYNFTNLQSFLDLYYQGCAVLLTEQDFYDLTMAYLTRANDDNIGHVELFFDPQAHTARGVPFDTVVHGIHRALLAAKHQYGMSSRLIMCILRDRSEQDGMVALEQAILRHKGQIHGIGLDSAELGNPPSKFEKLFDRAKAEGFFTVAHAGEEGPPSYIWGALEKLHVKRIDHGVRCVEDQNLVKKLAEERTPLTICPLSNIKLNVFYKMEDHNLKKLLEQNLCVTINSDDPAYFDGYLGQNYLEVSKSLSLNKADIIQLARNAIEATALTAKGKIALEFELNSFIASYPDRN